MFKEPSDFGERSEAAKWHFIKIMRESFGNSKKLENLKNSKYYDKFQKHLKNSKKMKNVTKIEICTYSKIIENFVKN